MSSLPQRAPGAEHRAVYPRHEASRSHEFDLEFEREIATNTAGHRFLYREHRPPLAAALWMKISLRRRLKPPIQSPRFGHGQQPVCRAGFHRPELHRSLFVVCPAPIPGRSVQIPPSAPSPTFPTAWIPSTTRWSSALTAASTRAFRSRVHTPILTLPTMVRAPDLHGHEQRPEPLRPRPGIGTFKFRHSSPLCPGCGLDPSGLQR